MRPELNDIEQLPASLIFSKTAFTLTDVIPNNWQTGSTFFYITLFETSDLGDNCIQNVHLGRYIVGYMVGNFVLRRRVSGAVKCNFRPYNRQYTSPNEHFEYGYPHSNAIFKIYSSKAQYFAPN